LCFSAAIIDGQPVLAGERHFHVVLAGLEREHFRRPPAMRLKGISAAPIVARPLEERAQINKGRLIAGRAEKLPITRYLVDQLDLAAADPARGLSHVVWAGSAPAVEALLCLGEIEPEALAIRRRRSRHADRVLTTVDDRANLPLR